VKLPRRFAAFTLLCVAAEVGKRHSYCRYYGEPPLRITSFALHRFGGFPLLRLAAFPRRHDLLDIVVEAGM